MCLHFLIILTIKTDIRSILVLFGPCLYEAFILEPITKYKFKLTKCLEKAVCRLNIYWAANDDFKNEK